MAVVLEDRSKILELFIDAFEGSNDFVFIDGINPCCVKYKGKKYNVYIKNLTPARLSNNNEDVWRIQLPKKPVFDQIKQDSSVFLLLGYDKDADVFATWNPYWTKQRLNIGESVSLYSRHHLQEEACIKGNFVDTTLHHNWKVIIFPRTLLPTYLDNMISYFPEETKYVAVGSSLRKGKCKDEENSYSSAELFYIFTNRDNLYKYEDYLRKSTTLQGKTIRNYVYCLSYLFDNDLFNKNKSLFAPVTSVSMLEEVMSKLYNSNEEIKQQDIIWHGGIHASIKKYLKFSHEVLFTDNNSVIENDTSSENDNAPFDNESAQYFYNYPESNSTNFVNQPLKKDCQDESHCDIKNIAVIEMIAHYMSQEPPQTLKAMEIISDYMGDWFVKQRSLREWFVYINDTDWDAELRYIRKHPEVSSSHPTDADNTMQLNQALVDIIRNHGDVITKQTADKFLSQKKAKIKKNEKYSQKRLVSVKGRSPFLISEDSTLVKLLDAGASVIPTPSQTVFMVIIRYQQEYYLTMFDWDGEPLKNVPKEN